VAVDVIAHHPDDVRRFVPEEVADGEPLEPDQELDQHGPDQLRPVDLRPPVLGQQGAEQSVQGFRGILDVKNPRQLRTHREPRRENGKKVVVVLQKIEPGGDESGQKADVVNRHGGGFDPVGRLVLGVDEQYRTGLDGAAPVVDLKLAGAGNHVDDLPEIPAMQELAAFVGGAVNPFVDEKREVTLHRQIFSAQIKDVFHKSQLRNYLFVMILSAG